MAWRQPYRGLLGRTEHRALRWYLYAHETGVRSEYVGRSCRRRNSSFNGLGGSSGTERHRVWRMERTSLQRRERRRLASCRAALRMAVPPFQLLKLAHSGGVQERGIPHARVDERADERPRRAPLCDPLLPHLRGAVVVPDHGSRIPGHEQRRQCVDGQGGVEVLANGGS